MGWRDKTIDIAIHRLSDGNNNTVMEDSVYLYFFELPSDLEGIRWQQCPLQQSRFFETKDILLRFGAEKESYDQVIKKLIGDAGLKELDARWNQILAEDEFIPLDEL